MRRVLWWLVGGSRGGRNRLRIIRTLEETPMNANQLSKALELDYKTTQHHLELLVENNVLMTMGEDYGKMYFLTDAMEQNLDVLDEVARQADLEPAGATADPEDGEPADPEDGEPADPEDGEPADRESTDPEDDHGD